MNSFMDVIGAWGSNNELAADLGESVSLVAVWKHRNSIPPQYWCRLVAAAERRQIEGVTLESLARLAELRASSRKRRESAEAA